MPRQKLEGPPLRRAGSVDVQVLDESERRVRLSFSSEIPYRRTNWWTDEAWIEVLGHQDSEVDLSRLNGGAAVLADHRNTIDQQVGVVEKAWVEDGRGYADVRLSKREDVSSLWDDIRDFIIRNISVGYQILERTLVRKADGEDPEYRVTRWLPMEISFVAIPADASVGVGRSDGAPVKFRITDLPLSKETTMDENEQERADNTEPARKVDDDAAAREGEAGAAAVAAEAARTAERTRVSSIAEAVRKAGLPGEVAEHCIREGLTIEATREHVINELAKRDVNHRSHRIEGGVDEAVKQRAGAVAWLLYRAGERLDGKPIDLQGNEFRGLTLLDLCRRTLERNGVRTAGMTNLELVARAITHSTSDFPVILENTMHKTLLAAYAAVPDAWRRFCAIGTVSDFRAHNRYRTGSFSDLAEIGENGEFKDGTLPDAEKQSISAKTKGRILNVSRQMIVNDDLGAFLDLSRLLGRAAARSIEKDVFALFALNSGAGPTLGDGKALFHVDHNNLAASGAAPTVVVVDTVRQAMASQMDVGGNDYIGIVPAVVVCPNSLGGTFRVINDSQFDPDAANKLQRPNISRGTFRDVVDTPRLTGTAWYVFAAPEDEPVFEVAFLNGQQTPFLEMQEGFRVDGVQWKVRLDYGVGGVGYRGAYKQPGA